MNKLLEELKRDKFLLIISFGLLLPILYLIILLTTRLQIIAFLVSPSLLVFICSLGLLVWYLPIFKFKAYRGDFLTKTLFYMWIIIGIGLTLVWLKINVLKDAAPESFNLTYILPIFLVALHGALFLTGLFILLIFLLAKRFENSRNLFAIVIISCGLSAIIAALIIYQLKPNKIKLDYPFTFELRSGQFSCDSLMGTSLYASNSDSEKGIFGSLDKGTDKLAVEVDGNQLYFLTQAALETGTSRGEPWEILRNDERLLVAEYNDVNGASESINIFTVNKKNGMGLWTKTTANFLFVNNPDAQSYYLHCK